MAKLVLLSDVGGTNARFQLWDAAGPDDSNPSLRVDQRYPSRDFAGLEGLLRRFLSDAGWELPEGEAASVAHAAEYAGPVVDGCCIAICGPVDDERTQSGPSLPEQGPTGWGSDIHEALEVGLGAVIKKAVLVSPTQLTDPLLLGCCSLALLSPRVKPQRWVLKDQRLCRRRAGADRRPRR